MVVTFNPAISSIRTYDVAFGNSEKIQPKKAEITSQELNAGKRSIGRASHWFHNAAAGLLFTTAALFGGCAKDETPAPVNPVDPPVTEISATQKQFTEYQDAMYGTGTTKSTTALKDSLSYDALGQTHAYKYDYTNPDTVVAKAYTLEDGVVKMVVKEKTWKASDGTLTKERGGPSYILKYTKDNDGKIIETIINGSKAKYFPQGGNKVLVKDLNISAEQILTNVKMFLKK